MRNWEGPDQRHVLANTREPNNQSCFSQAGLSGLNADALLAEEDRHNHQDRNNYDNGARGEGHEAGEHLFLFVGFHAAMFVVGHVSCPFTNVGR